VRWGEVRWGEVRWGESRPIDPSPFSPTKLPNFLKPYQPDFQNKAADIFKTVHRAPKNEEAPADWDRGPELPGLH
jgi:hypothetical protein